MKPFFRIAGGKNKTANKYPPRKYPKVREPFCASAGYSTYYEAPVAILCDANPSIRMAWQYLLDCARWRAPPRQWFKRLPSGEPYRFKPRMTGWDRNPFYSLPGDLEQGTRLDQLRLTPEQQNYLGLVINVGNGQPRKTVTRWPLWTEEYRDSRAAQLPKIRDWELSPLDDGLEMMVQYKHETETTWFIDTPYQNKQLYKYKLGPEYYRAMAEVVRELKGQVIVCEDSTANWLPFRKLTTAKRHSNAGEGSLDEMIWTNG